MAADDMHVVMCKIMRYLYDCMKAGEEPDIEKISPSALGIPRTYWSDIWHDMVRRGFIDGVGVRDTNDVPWINMVRPVVTLAGVEFMEESTMMAKALKLLKETRGLIPLP